MGPLRRGPFGSEGEVTGKRGWVSRPYGVSGRGRTCNLPIRSRWLYPFELRRRMTVEWIEEWSRWRDSNPRPPAPKAGALTKLSYT